MKTFATLLTVLFIGLKLTNHITWSWLWVLAPLWCWAALYLALWLFILSVALITPSGREKLKDLLAP
jgi:hypothetical protein